MIYHQAYTAGVVNSIPAGLVCMKVFIVTNYTGEISQLAEYIYAGLIMD